MTTHFDGEQAVQISICQWFSYMTNNYRICHVLTPSETNTRFICHVLTPSELFAVICLQQISAKAFARFAHWTVVLLRFRPNKSSKYWKIKTRRTRRKVQNSEACILGIKNIRLTWGLLPVLIFIYMADFSCKMNNKRIIEFGLRRISELFRPRSALSASAFGFGR